MKTLALLLLLATTSAHAQEVVTDTVPFVFDTTGVYRFQHLGRCQDMECGRECMALFQEVKTGEVLVTAVSQRLWCCLTPGMLVKGAHLKIR